MWLWFLLSQNIRVWKLFSKMPIEMNLYRNVKIDMFTLFLPKCAMWQ